MSPRQRVSPTKVRSPLYAGSPGALQAQSPYRHATLQQNSPDHVAGLHQMPSSPRTFTAQSHPTQYPQYSGTTQGSHSSTAQPRRMYLYVFS